ncbi:thymus-specific serine protease-like [Liolophura sinensis]|uniref:thymus-specific serine protease-like n=1 Tax=Liolophura sinensis TaxID=3198878 RepID=UPI003158D4B7
MAWGRRYPVALYVMLMSATGIYAVSPSLWRIRDLVERQRREEIHHQLELTEIRNGAKEIFITQPLDHFDASEEGMYKQRVYVNDQYWKTNGPVFLYIGGEGSLAVFDVLGGEHVDLARKYGALLFAVEHRYYGASINDDGLRLRNMKFLSSQQALADLASFYQYAVNTYQLTPSNTWICFGGSYPGALSAWFRVKYPHIVYGAVASSAPVEAEVNFEGYNDVVAASLKDPVVQGSELCLANVKQAFADIDQLIENGMFNQLRQDFLSCNDISAHYDMVTFVGNLAGIIMGIAQYNNQVQFQNITTFCKYMTQASQKPYQNLVKYNEKLLSMSGRKCADNSWSGFLASLSNTTVDRSGFGVGLRQWLYQTCTQFGYYQTCDTNTTCPFSRFMDLDSNTVICEEIFEIPAAEVAKRVTFTNEFYGSNRPSGSRIIFVNGSIDPWHALSVLKNLADEEIAVFINGTSHCQNMGSNRPGDAAALRAARMEIDTIVGKWLEEAQSGLDNTLYWKA